MLDGTERLSLEARCQTTGWEINKIKKNDKYVYKKELVKKIQAGAGAGKR